MAIIVDTASEYGVRVIGDGGEDPAKGTVNIQTGGVQSALVVGRAAAGLTSVAPFRVTGTSLASGAVLGFGGGFISVTSILGFTATGAALGADYVLPVELNGVLRGIPMISLLSLPGAATF